MQQEQHDLEAYLREAVVAAKAAGTIILSGFGKASMAFKNESALDMVTQFDHRCEESIITHLRAAFPSHAFIGEETSAAEGLSRLPRNPGPTWVIDPIDGTTNFIHGLPMVAVSIALVIGYEPSVAVVYNPVTNSLYTATKGGGAFCNGHKMPMYSQSKSLLRLSGPDQRTKGTQGLLKGSILLGEGGHQRSPEVSGNRMRLFATILDTCQADGIRIYSSAAMGLAFVANGAADYFFEHGIHIWDVAAGVLLLTEAGGSWYGRSSFDSKLPEHGCGEDLYGRRFLAVRASSDDPEEAGIRKWVVQTLLEHILDCPSLDAE